MIIICCSLRGSTCMTQKPLLFSFLKVQSKYTVHKVIISKYFIWSWYSIHFVSLHHSYHHHHHHHLPIIIQQSVKSFNLPPLPFCRTRGGNWTLPDYIGEFESEVSRLYNRIQVLYQSLTVEVFKVNNALLLTNGLEGKSLQGLGFMLNHHHHHHHHHHCYPHYKHYHNYHLFHHFHQPKNLPWIYWEGSFLWRERGEGDYTHYLSFSGDRLSQADAN